MDTTQLLQLISNLGTGGIFLYLYAQTKKELTETRKDLSEKLEKRDEYNRQTNEKLVQIVENNTKAITEVTNAVDSNTKSTDMLVSRINNLIRNNNKK